MLSSISGKRFPAIITIIAVAAIGAVSVAARNAPRQGQPTPLQLFQRMFPAIRHPRCTNCHGIVDPETGKNHPGGRISSNPSDPTYEACTSCHSDAHEWMIPQPEHFFAGRTDKQICSQVSDFVSTFGQQAFMSKHVRLDDQIVQAFVGVAGGARSPGLKHADGTIDPPAEPPPMTHAAFIKAADDWITQGFGACTVEGTIRWEESVSSVDSFQTAPTLTHLATQTGTRTVTITSTAAGRFRADIEVNGVMIMESRHRSTNAQGQPCTVITTVRDQYAGTTTGPAIVAIKDTVFRVPSPRPPKIDYRIDVTLPPEKTRRTSATNIQDGCGVGLTSPPNEVGTFDWPAWEFTIEGYLDDVSARNAVGGCAKSVKWDEVGQTLSANVCNRFANMGNANEPWLVNHGASGSYHDGTPIPFDVNVTWNLRRR